jgi:16S rRNA G966 N2-methylase RsmD
MTKISQYKTWLQKADSQLFFRENKHAKISELLFKHHKNAELRFLTEQLAARQKVAKKLPTFSDNYQLLFPPSVNLEQSSSEVTARFKASFLGGESFADLTGGFGVDTYYMGTKFKEVSYAEPNAELFSIAEYNFKQLHFKVNASCCSAVDKLATLAHQNVIYLDPSRRSNTNQKLVALEDYSPNVVALEENLLKKASVVLIKVSPMFGLAEAVKKLKSLTEIWVLSHKNECKEVLLWLTHSPSPLPVYKTFNLARNTTQSFEGNPQAEAFGFAEPKAYLYEPNVSILKAGLVNSLSQKLGIPKLHPNTQLLTHSKILPNFPGKVYAITRLNKPFTKQLTKQRFNVVVKNYPEKASIIEKKLKLKPATDSYLIATQSLKQLFFITAELIKG